MVRRKLVVGGVVLLFLSAILYIQYLLGDGDLLDSFSWKADPLAKYRTKEYKEKSGKLTMYRSAASCGVGTYYNGMKSFLRNEKCPNFSRLAQGLGFGSQVDISPKVFHHWMEKIDTKSLETSVAQLKKINKNPRWLNDSIIFNGPTVHMDDPLFIASIRRHFLVPPAISSQPYQLKKPSIIDPSMGQASLIRQILKNKRNGFFVEAGAMDGETRSNTLYLEKELGWRGLLVEADPYNFANMISRNRRAWSSPTCLSTKPYPITVSFKQEENLGKISDREVGSPIPGYVDVQCLPLYSLLLALNVTTVHYFSLDVEGAELDVLKTIPFDKVDIQTLSVEFIHGPLGKDALRDWMEGKGYRVVAQVTHPDWLANDFIFVKESLFSTSDIWSIKVDEV